jgi:hypothetical protein
MIQLVLRHPELAVENKVPVGAMQIALGNPPG